MYVLSSTTECFFRVLPITSSSSAVDLPSSTLGTSTTLGTAVGKPMGNVSTLGSKWTARKELLKRTSKPNRRGWGKKSKRKLFKNQINEQIFSILGTNANGIRAKLDSLKNNISFFKPSCINIQETKLRFPGTIKLEGYEIFENI